MALKENKRRRFYKERVIGYYYPAKIGSGNLQFKYMNMVYAQSDLFQARASHTVLIDGDSYHVDNRATKKRHTYKSLEALQMAAEFGRLP